MRLAPAAALPAWPRCDRTAAWTELDAHYQEHGRKLDLRVAFACDPQRFAALSFAAPEVFADLSKNLVDVRTLRLLAELARQCGLEAQRDAMLEGSAINTSEDRAALHTALRAPPGAAPFASDMHRVLAPMLDFAEAVRRRAQSGAPGGARLRHVVAIGIGGSDLGPRTAVGALAAFVHPGLSFWLDDPAAAGEALDASTAGLLGRLA